MKHKAPKSLVGKTVRWSFAEGPTKGSSYEHTFKTDGSVVYKESGDKGEGTHEKRCVVDQITPDVHVISYLSASGYTLTVVLNFENMTIQSYASNEKTLSTAKGTFEVLKEPEGIA